MCPLKGGAARNGDDGDDMNLTGDVFYAFNSTLDIAIVIDGTFSSSEFSTIRSCLVSFADRFYVSSTLTRFAVVQFSQSQSTTFNFARYSANMALRTALSSLQQQSRGGVRDLGAALQYTYDRVFVGQARSNAAWVCSFL